MPTIKDANHIGRTVREIVRRVRKAFEDDGEGMERQVLRAVIADPEMQALLHDDDAQQAMVLAFLDHVVWFGDLEYDEPVESAAAPVTPPAAA
jgi:hypothetical protein